MEPHISSTDVALDDANATHAQPRKVQMKFFGETGEFFGIWIVNLLLTLVTLGIYSAWAKVRKLRYLYGNTELDGHRFSYLADPLVILKGRIIAFVIFMIFYFSSAVSPIVSLVFVFAYIFGVPFIIFRSIKFNMQMTGYRNIRFNFHGSYGGAFAAFILMPIVGMITFYTCMPLVFKQIDEFIINNTTFGDKKLRTRLNAKTYYKASILAALSALAIFGLFVMVTGFSFSNAETMKQLGPLLPVYMMSTYVGIFLVSGTIYSSIIRNHVFNNTEVKDVAQLHSTMTFSSLLWLRLSNFIIMIATLGLAIPWIIIRNSRYTCDKTQVTILPGADKIVADSDSEASAVGDELADAFDIDIGIA